MEQKMSLVLEKLDKGSEISTNEEAPCTVDECFQSFQSHILPEYPILKPVDLDTAKRFIDTRKSTTKRHRTGYEPMQRAEALLIYASGRFCCRVAKGEGGVDAQGRKTFDEAISLMQSERGSPNIRANILAALYSSLHGRGAAPIPYVQMAGSMLVKSAEDTFSHLKGATHTKVLASKENQFLLLYWSCLMMEM
jgi:hypothetical protein